MKYLFAPVQGHTDAAYRHFHSQLYGGNLIYTTPFIRLEKDGLRPKDLKDLKSELNNGVNLIPQIIFRDSDELEKLVKLLKNEGVRRLDLNMGCPFPLQTGHGRGAATVANDVLAEAVVETINKNPDIRFSVKIRLGMENPKEWESLISKLNDVDLEYITVHPRVARQQYGGELHIEEFESILKKSKNPIIFNGDIRTPEQAKEIIRKYPDIAGIMIGRGALGRPSIFREIISGEDEEREDRIKGMLKFHRILSNHYEEILCGESQVLSKISPFWDYSEDEIGRKAWKQIQKAKTLPKYRTAVAGIS